MGRTTEVAIATLPVVACLALLFGAHVLPDLWGARIAQAAEPQKAAASPPLPAPGPGVASPRPLPTTQPQVRVPAEVPTVAAARLGTTAPAQNQTPLSPRATPNFTAPSTAAVPAPPVPRVTVPPARTPTATTPPAQVSRPGSDQAVKTTPPGPVVQRARPSGVPRAEPRPGPRPAPKLAQAGPQASSSSALVRGRQLTGALYSRSLGPLWASFHPKTKRTWISLSALETYRARLLTTYGAERQVLSEQVRQGRGVRYYLRTAVFARGTRQGRTLIFGLNPSGQVISFGVVPASSLIAAPRR